MPPTASALASLPLLTRPAAADADAGDDDSDDASRSSMVEFSVSLELRGGGQGPVYGRYYKPKQASWTLMLSLCDDVSSDGLVLAVKRLQLPSGGGSGGRRGHHSSQSQSSVHRVTLQVPAVSLKVPAQVEGQAQAPGLYLDVMCDSVLGLDCRVKIT